MGVPKLTINGSLATITLARPDKANRLEPDDLSTLLAHLHEVDSRTELRVLQFNAAGKYFSSGYDISRLASETDVSFADVIDAVEDSRTVTIAVLQGGVYGGATDLALACDFRLGTDDVDMFMPAARLGVMFSDREVDRFISRLGINNAKRLFLTGERMNAREMHRIGFLTHLAPQDELEAMALRLVDDLGGMAPLALLSMKKHFNRKMRGLFDEADLHEDIARMRVSSDRLEAVAAWKEKRAPRFTGC